MLKKLMIATGGTGGHVYPAMALAQQCARDQIEVLFIGGGLAQNKYFDRDAFPFKTISCGAFTQRSPFAILQSCSRIVTGIWQSRDAIRKFNPDAIVGFGSYYSFPPLVAAKWQSIPIILHEANSIPGKVNKWLSPYATVTGVHFPGTRDLVKGRSCEVGMPLRERFTKDAMSQSDARRYFGLSEQSLVLLVFGGSQGARTINSQVLEALKISNLTNIEVLHIAGDAQQVPFLQQQYADLHIHACVKVFEERMDIAWQAADFVISRAGASSIAEQLEFEVPGILIPFPHAAEDHQNHNADFLVHRVNGAKKLQEKELNPRSLALLMREFIDESSLATMKAGMKHYKETARSQDLYSLILEAIC